MSESTDESRATSKSLRVTPAVHDRLTAHARDGETLSGCLGRALDALERESELPDAVAEVLRDDG